MNHEKVVLDLKKEASSGNHKRIKTIFDSNRFNQSEIDEAFRFCIRNYNKNLKDSYVNCIKIFLNKIQDINFQNSNYNNTTILMYSIDESQETATDMIISCYKEDLDINLKDDNQNNTIFHLIKNDKFSSKIQSDFIKDLILNDFNLNTKNNKNETIISILTSKKRECLYEEIKNKINENKFNQNKLTNLYNENKYEELIELMNKYEQNEKQEIINKNSLKFNKLYIELKIIINSEGLHKGIADNLIKNDKSVNSMLESKVINDYQCKILNILRKETFDKGGGDGEGGGYGVCLIINKMIMLYQIDHYYDLFSLMKNVEKNNFFNSNIYFILYKFFILFDMMIERNYYTKALGIFNNLKYKLKDINVDLEENRDNSNKNNDKKENNKPKKNNKIIIPKDIPFDLKNLNNILNMYKTHVNSFIINSTNSNENTSSFYTKSIKELKNIKFVENQQINVDNYKNLQKYLIIKLNYLNATSKNTKNKINYKFLSDNNLNINFSSIKNNKIELELNKIYYYNYQGIISLNNNNYNLASYFFMKCLQLIAKKNEIQLIKRNHFYPSILFNLALSFFFSKKYVKTMKHLYFLINYSNNKSKFFANYKYIYYRLGLSQLELLLKEDKNINMLYNSFVNKKFILKTKKNSFNEKMIKLTEVIEAFKKTFILIKNNHNDKIYFSTLLNLTFCLIINENYLEAIYYLKKNKSENSEHLKIIKCYLMQCYIYLGKIEQARNISKEMILNEKYNNQDKKFYERLNERLITINGFKMSILINFIKLCVESGNIKELEKYLFVILDCINLNISLDDKGIITNEEIPSFIINVFVYYYLLIDRKDLAINILKTRKIKEINFIGK